MLRRLKYLGGAVAIWPLLVVTSGWMASFVSKRFLFHGDLHDFAPGDAMGELLLFLGILSLLSCVDAVLWYKAYRRP
jgi:hypothetical protein